MLLVHWTGSRLGVISPPDPGLSKTIGLRPARLLRLCRATLQRPTIATRREVPICFGQIFALFLPRHGSRDTGTGMFAPEVTGPTVTWLAELAGDGRALELAIGTGRVAVPLSERGVPVTGIELSGPMIEQLRAKAAEAATPVIAGDMATARAPGTYTLVYVVYNAISCLQTKGEQVGPTSATPLGTWLPAAGSLSSCGYRNCASSRQDYKRSVGTWDRAASSWIPSTCCTST